MDKSEQLKQLVTMGKTRGFVLYDEIDELLPPGYEGGAKLDTIFSELAKNGVEVLEGPEVGREKGFIEDDRFLREKEFRDFSEQCGDSAPVQMYLREVLTTPHLTREREIELAKCISYGERDVEDALRQLIEANLWLVVATAKRHRNRGHDLLELIQKGNIGLMRAAKSFNYLREYKFSTYAIWWVRQAIMRSTRGK
jgi:DNA-directed RNA polymerase sigma subunit (sigma70/sigma32)